MSYDIEYLINNFDECVLKLGVDSRILEHPSFPRIKNEIIRLIKKMSIGNEKENIRVYQENNKIFFNRLVNGELCEEKYSFLVFFDSVLNILKGITSYEREPFGSFKVTPENYKKKEFNEVVTYVSDNGSIEFVLNRVIVDNYNVNHNDADYNYRGEAEKCEYSPDGVMLNREFKTFNSNTGPRNFRDVNRDNMLYTLRKGFGTDLCSDNYSSYASLTRIKLDTARLFIEDRNREFGYKYSVVTPLDREHGLRDMVAVCTPGRHPEGILIKPLSQNEIDLMIQKEKNPKVAEGLKKYAVGRDTYSYNPLEDECFVYEPNSNSKGMSR